MEWIEDEGTPNRELQKTRYEEERKEANHINIIVLKRNV